MDTLDTLHSTKYARLRSYRADGNAVDTPIWFRLEGPSLVFRTKIGPKTRRLAARPEVEITACDHLGRVSEGVPTVRGLATLLNGDDAEAANAALHKRYGWQWNTVPMLKIPGVTNVNNHLSLRDKLRRMRSRTLWPDSAIIRVDFSNNNTHSTQSAAPSSAETARPQ